jgi:hypothetical protein
MFPVINDDDVNPDDVINADEFIVPATFNLNANSGVPIPTEPPLYSIVVPDVNHCDDTIGLLSFLYVPVILISPVTLNIFEVVSHVKLPFSVIGFVPLPINKRPTVKLLAPVPPLVTVKVPSLTLVVFKLVNSAPEPVNLPALNILLTYVKLVEVITGSVPLPTKI